MPRALLRLSTFVALACSFPSCLTAAERPPKATDAEVAAARAAMSEERFWNLIAAARRRGGEECSELANALASDLRKLKPEEILGFDLRFQERMAESYRWDLWAVAYIVNGGASDDGFEYFRAWLIGQGREYYEAALKTPERAADRAGKAQDNECEELLYVAMKAHESKAGKPLPILPVPRPKDPKGEHWSEEQLPRLFPALAKRFRS